MDFLVQALTDWLKEILVGGIMGNLSGMFNTVNQKVGEISTQTYSTWYTACPRRLWSPLPGSFWPL